MAGSRLGWMAGLPETINTSALEHLLLLRTTRGSLISYQLEMNFVTFSLMVDLQIRVFRVGGMGCFQLVSSIKVSPLIKAFCLWEQSLVFF